MREIGLEDTATQFFGRASNAVDRTDDGIHQFVHVERTAVGEFAFSQRPNPFVRVKVGGVGRKVLDVQARMSAEELPQTRAVVRGGVVEQNDDGTPKVAQQLPEKQTHFLLPHVVEVKEIVEAQVLSLGADRDSRDDGNLVAPSLTMMLKGGAALGCPSSDYQGSQQEARFIGED
jgi:hypothetical protein